MFTQRDEAMDQEVGLQIMTREQIEALEPGRELRRLIALHVFGATAAEIWDEEVRVWPASCIGKPDYANCFAPRWESDPVANAALWDKLRADGWSVHVGTGIESSSQPDEIRGVAWAEVWQGKPLDLSFHDTGQTRYHALAKAALLAYGEEEPADSRRQDTSSAAVAGPDGRGREYHPKTFSASDARGEAPGDEGIRSNAETETETCVGRREISVRTGMLQTVCKTVREIDDSMESIAYTFKSEVCKTFMRGFDSRSRLHPNSVETKQLNVILEVSGLLHRPTLKRAKRGRSGTPSTGWCGGMVAGMVA